jgi:hypothetical protein
MNEQQRFNWTVFTCLVQIWNGKRWLVGGIAFNECTPAQAVRRRFGEELTISRLRRWPDDTSIEEALERTQAELVLTVEAS